MDLRRNDTEWLQTTLTEVLPLWLSLFIELPLSGVIVIEKEPRVTNIRRLPDPTNPNKAVIA
jgi:hypothetical protein